jgi:hypothetical protein
VTASRYPSHDGKIEVDPGQVFTVTAVNEILPSGELFLGESASATANQCYEGAGQVPVTYYLHSDPTPPRFDELTTPPYAMNETEPSHSVLYNYNSDDPSKPGREVKKGGGTPPGETDLETYIEWFTGKQTMPLTLESDVTLVLWGKNPSNQPVVATAYLYKLDSDGYHLISYNSYTWPAGVTEWEQLTLNIGGENSVIPTDSELRVWIVSNNAKSLHFAYDTRTYPWDDDYPSRIEFLGRWGDGSD